MRCATGLEAVADLKENVSMANSTDSEADATPPKGRGEREPQTHRTVDRVTRILEEVVYRPGMTFVELARALEAPKSSVYGFIQGLLAKGWLYEDGRRFYLGPAVYGLTLASGQIRAGLVTHDDLAKLNNATGLAVFLGVQAGDHLIYVAEAGSDAVVSFEARANIHRAMLATAGGKALLAARPQVEREAFLRRHAAEGPELVAKFLQECEEIRRTRISMNLRANVGRFAVATTVNNQSGQAVASVTLVGPIDDVQPRSEELSKLLLKSVSAWSQRKMRPREAI
jgi:DNA-binding IclR family transcriptional regulator